MFFLGTTSSSIGEARVSLLHLRRACYMYNFHRSKHLWIATELLRIVKTWPRLWRIRYGYNEKMNTRWLAFWQTTFEANRWTLKPDICGPRLYYTSLWHYIKLTDSNRRAPANSPPPQQSNKRMKIIKVTTSHQNYAVAKASYTWVSFHMTRSVFRCFVKFSPSKVSPTYTRGIGQLFQVSIHFHLSHPQTKMIDTSFCALEGLLFTNPKNYFNVPSTQVRFFTIQIDAKNRRNCPFK